MAQALPLASASIQEYLDFEKLQPDKHELFRGLVYAMAGGSSNHGNIIDSLAQVCGRALQSRKPCRFVGESRKVVIQASGSGYYPDGAIGCPPNDLDPQQGTYDNPVVIFEVLSPSTEKFDRRDKADDYKTLPLLQDYVLIESDRARLEVFSRLTDGRWAQSVHLKGSVARLPSIGIDLPLDEIFENAVLDADPQCPVEQA